MHFIGQITENGLSLSKYRYEFTITILKRNWKSIDKTENGPVSQVALYRIGTNL